MTGQTQHRVVIVGGGFAGLYAARQLKHAPVHVTLLDKRNFHLFQPLLYQVASGSLSPGDIAEPLREMLAHQKNAEVLLGEMVDLDPENKWVILREDRLAYDTLVLAPGSTKQYFGHEEWQEHAPGIKTIEDAVRIRRQVLYALEVAEKETDDKARAAWLTFVVVGGGPTGVELAGTLAELIHGTLKENYRHINLNNVKILMLEAGDRILSSYSPELQEKALQQLKKLGIVVKTNQMVKNVTDKFVTVNEGQQSEDIQTRTTLWTAGVKVSPLGKILSNKLGCPLDKGGRVLVGKNCSIPGHPDIFVLGDLANFSHTPNQKPLPALASVAMQQGQYVGRYIQRRLAHQSMTGFYYYDKGSLAIIGRNSAIAEIGNFRLSGFPAWLIWFLVHIFYLVGFENKILVMLQWAWNYLTQKRSACLITE